MPKAAESVQKRKGKSGSRLTLPKLLRQVDVADVLGVDPRQVRNLEVAAFEGGLPTDDTSGEKLYPTRACQKWYVRFKQNEAIGRSEKSIETDRDEAERRKIVADARLAEIRVAKEESALIPNDVHINVVAELADRLRARAINIPGTFVLDLEREGVAPKRAQEILERIADGVISELRLVADEIEMDEGTPDEKG